MPVNEVKPENETVDKLNLSKGCSYGLKCCMSSSRGVKMCGTQRKGGKENPK